MPVNRFNVPYTKFYEQDIVVVNSKQAQKDFVPFFSDHHAATQQEEEGSHNQWSTAKNNERTM